MIVTVARAMHGVIPGVGDTARLMAWGTHGTTHGAGAPFVVRPFPPLHINHYRFDHCPLP